MQLRRGGRFCSPWSWCSYAVSQSCPILRTSAALRGLGARMQSPNRVLFFALQLSLAVQVYEVCFWPDGRRRFRVMASLPPPLEVPQEHSLPQLDDVHIVLQRLAISRSTGWIVRFVGHSTRHSTSTPCAASCPSWELGLQSGHPAQTATSTLPVPSVSGPTNSGSS